jgi:hypothetical protein
MVHLGALPGSPGHSGSMNVIVDQALRDATLLADLGYSAIMVENFGDAPFYADDVPPITVAAMTRVVTEIRNAVTVPIGINVLRNDGLSAIAVAAATDASFIRINVLSGSMYTDQGLITGQAAEVGRSRATLAPDLSILADVFVKHASPPPGATLEQSAIDTWERGGAQALVLSGAGTGKALEIDDALRVRTAVPDAPLVVGSGATESTLPQLVEAFDSIIVGSSIKQGGLATEPVDQGAAGRLVDLARRLDWI